MQTDKEIAWKEIKGFEGLYLISEYGDVFSLKSNKRLNNSINAYGYRRRVLSKDGKIYRNSVHRLVALNFLLPVPGKNYVNHKDGDKLNNHYSNLEWCTMLENNVHAYATGLKVLPKGKDDKRSVPIVQMDLSGNFIKDWASAREAERVGGFKQSNIWHCCKGNQHKSQGFKWAYK